MIRPAIILISLVLSQLSQAQDPVSPYLEENGLIVIEAEDQSFDTAFFKLESSIDGYSGTGYLVGQINSYNAPGKGIVDCPIIITTTGRYQLAWKSRITVGDSHTDANDTWARMIDSQGAPVTPVPNDMHASSSGWHKSYMNRANSWWYDASNKDNDPHSISWQLEAGKTYSFQFSVRSKDHGLDRIVLWDTSKHAFANTLTGKNSKFAELDALPRSRRENEVVADTDQDGLPDEWEELYGSSATSIDPDSDDDQDKLPALLEFALGTDPTSPTLAPSLSKIEIDGTSYFSYNYTRSLAAVEHVDLRPYHSNGLTSWSDDDLNIEAEWKTINENLVSARALLPADNQEALNFFKLVSEKK